MFQVALPLDLANLINVDYFKTGASFAVVALRNPFSVVASIIPHIMILGAFGAFVLWNNGVVLGKTRCQRPPSRPQLTLPKQDTRSSILLESI